MKVRWSGSPENYFLSFILVNNKLIDSGPNLYMLKLIRATVAAVGATVMNFANRVFGSNSYALLSC